MQTRSWAHRWFIPCLIPLVVACVASANGQQFSSENERNRLPHLLAERAKAF
jgi:hypothetical protein